MKKVFLAIVALSFISNAVLAQTSSKSIHVDLTVQEEGQPIEVKLTLPLGLVEAMRPNIINALQHFESADEGVDIRSIWREIRAAGPNEYVNISDEDNEVMVSTDEDNISIKIDSLEEGKVNITAPLALGDLFFSTDGTFDLSEAIASLEAWEGDLIVLSGDKVNGHIWVE